MLYLFLALVLGLLVIFQVESPAKELYFILAYVLCAWHTTIARYLEECTGCLTRLLRQVPAKIDQLDTRLRLKAW